MIPLCALVGVCFFLPFATVSCGSASTTFTGAQLVTQTVPHGGVLNEDECSGEISHCVERSGSARMTVALLAAALPLCSLRSVSPEAQAGAPPPASEPP